MTDLSPAAKAVYDAFWIHESRYPDDLSTSDLANALRAAVDQVVPEGYTQAYDCCLEIMGDIRKELLAIAAELEDCGG